MSIPRQAVDAAAQAGYERLEGCEWAELPYEERKVWTEDYGHAIEAAYPFIAARVLRDASEDCNCGDDADLLDAKADLMEDSQW